MSSIAYITDPNMLELHRLNGHSTMNFWRLSSKVNFKDFSKEDLVFFLSKDKELQKGKEKAIVGYGKLESIEIKSVNYLWKKYKTENGYLNINDFKEALIKVSKNHELPKQISSLYLKEIMFFQAPLYLSECGLNISGNVESFIYLKPEVTLKLLNSKVDLDTWFEASGGKSYIEKHKFEYAISLTQEKIKDINVSKSIINKGNKALRKYIENHPEYSFVKGSKLTLKKTTNDNEITFLLYNHSSIDYKLICGQASLYKHYMYMYYPNIKKLSFETIDDSLELERIINY